MFMKENFLMKIFHELSMKDGSYYDGNQIKNKQNRKGKKQF